MEVHIILDRDQTLETDFLSNFSTNLELLNNINNAIVTSLYPKTPTQLFKTKYKKVCKSDVGKECSICFDEYFGIWKCYTGRRGRANRII